MARRTGGSLIIEHLTRRELLKVLSASTFFFSLADPASARAGPRPADAAASGVSFPQGVASADPQPDSIILWTRAVPENGAREFTLQVQLSEDPGFHQVLMAADLDCTGESDYTVRVHLRGLAPDRWYYYRFVGIGGATSRTGRTRTAPPADQSRNLNLAFVTCQNFEDNHYGAWARLLADDEAAPPDKQIDLVLHLGDFIYERCWERSEGEHPAARRVPLFPDGARLPGRRWAVTLADYRHLYRTYLSDPHLQAARARWPFACTWDDHEFSNNNFQSYVTYDRQTRLDAARKLAANQAWFEYIPAALDELDSQPCHGYRSGALGAGEREDNAAAVTSLSIYRRLRWGSDVDLVFTDTRSFRTAPCLPPGFAASHGLPLMTVEAVQLADGGKAANNGRPPEKITLGEDEIDNPWRDREPGTCLGLEQRQWFLDSLKNSGATWKLWANSVPLFPMRLDLASIPLGGYQDSLLTIDAWAGYPHEQGLLLDELRAAGISGLVSLSGDHHMHAAAAIHPEPPGEVGPVLVDFAVAGISSTPMYVELLQEARKRPELLSLVETRNNDGLLPNWHMTLLHGTLAALAYDRTGWAALGRWLGPNRANTGLIFVDSLANGYGLARVESTTINVELVGIEGMQDRFEEAPPVRYRARFQLPAWQAGETPELRGPDFEGNPPFPFAHPRV